jgi:hypothetical protein
MEKQEAFDDMLEALRAVDHWLIESPIREIQMAEHFCGIQAPTLKVRAAIAKAEALKPERGTTDDKM